MSKLAISVLVLVCLSPAACRNPASNRASAPRDVHDLGGRVVTVERWAFVAGFATAWAVYPDKVCVFTKNDYEKPEHLIAEQSISAGGLAAIKKEIARLPAGLIGKHFSKVGVHDGVFFRISFSPRGALAPDRIEFENMHLPGVAPLLSAIDAQAPAGHKIHCEKMISSRFNNLETRVADVYVP